MIGQSRRPNIKAHTKTKEGITTMWSTIKASPLLFVAATAVGSVITLGAQAGYRYFTGRTTVTTPKKKAKKHPATAAATA